MFGTKYSAKLLSDAKRQYPFVSQYNPIVNVANREGGYAETWPTGEEGDKSYPRPIEFPMDRVGVQVFRPDQFTPQDLAAEMLHVDPFANATRAQLGRSLSPEQSIALKNESGDYQQSVQMGLAPEKAMANAVDSAMRGYTVGQWPQSANDGMNYSPDQARMLDDLRSYMGNGYYPLDYKLPRK